MFYKLFHLVLTNFLHPCRHYRHHHHHFNLANISYLPFFLQSIAFVSLTEGIFPLRLKRIFKILFYNEVFKSLLMNVCNKNIVSCSVGILYADRMLQI